MNLPVFNIIKRSNKDKCTFAFYVGYCVLIIFAILHHEPWRDETHAWLIARDMDYLPLLHNLQVEGAMPLWHTILYIISRLGAPFESIYILNYLFIATASYIVLFKSPFPKLVSVSVILSSLFLYEFSVVARHYGMSTCLLVTILNIFPKRDVYNIRYVSLLFLLFFSNVFAVFMALALFVEFCFKKQIKTKYLVIGAMPLVLIFAIYAYPRILEHISLMQDGCCGIFSLINKGAWKLKIWTTLFNAYVILSTLYVFTYFRKEKIGKLVIALWGLNLIWFFYICYIGYYCSFYRTLNLYLYLTAGVWLLSQNVKLNKEHKIFLFGVVVIASLNTFHVAVQNHIYDFKKPFSASTEMSNYIKNNIPDDHIIATGRIVFSSAVLANLDQRKLYYIPKSEFRTHYDYKTDHYYYYLWRNYPEVFDRFLKKFSSEKNPIYFLEGHDLSQKLGNHEIGDKNNAYLLKHLEFVHEADGKKEKLFLYKVKNSGS